MIKNPYKRPDHRAAFDKALELLRAGLDRFETSKQLKELDPALPRGLRQTISAKAARLLSSNNQLARSEP